MTRQLCIRHAVRVGLCTVWRTNGEVNCLYTPFWSVSGIRLFIHLSNSIVICHDVYTYIWQWFAVRKRYRMFHMWFWDIGNSNINGFVKWSLHVQYLSPTCVRYFTKPLNHSSPVFQLWIRQNEKWQGVAICYFKLLVYNQQQVLCKVYSLQFFISTWDWYGVDWPELQSQKDESDEEYGRVDIICSCTTKWEML